MRELEEGEKPVAIHVENRPKRVRMGGGNKEVCNILSLNHRKLFYYLKRNAIQ